MYAALDFWNTALKNKHFPMNYSTDDLLSIYEWYRIEERGEKKEERGVKKTKAMKQRKKIKKLK